MKVDDRFYSHPKVLATSPAALGLWVVAGSWCGATSSDGVVPDHVLPRLLPDPLPLANELVTNGLWKRTRGGYRFHDWEIYNPTAAVTAVSREKDRIRQARRRAKERASQTREPEERRSEQVPSRRDTRVTPSGVTPENTRDPGSGTGGSFSSGLAVVGVTTARARAKPRSTTDDRVATTLQLAERYRQEDGA